ncbi:hydantoinase/oxoprolinase family protein [Cyanobium sp. ATX-6F1]|uniref:hydantoinase/oxoprolinase family protein n=1 Tax=Cyanobium sp. ATX-6F1 TaxID=3137388 RepID=UPI0039BE50BF
MIDLGLAWRFWIDRGGTFTDLVARSPGGELVVRKVLSAAAGGDPVVAAIRELVGVGPGEPLPKGAIAEVRLGTTVATNALLERSGAPTLLLVSCGFADALLIGDQHRLDLFALRIVKPDQLLGRVLEVGGRLAADGSELEPLGLDAELEVELRRAHADGYRSVAVALLHGARHPCHERALGEWLRQLGFNHVALSHRVSPLTKLVPRAQTAVVEAYVDPPLRAYLGQLQAELGPDCGLRVMQSSGGLIAPEQLRAKDTILSGPAGGLVGACRIAAAAGLGAIVGFDMGGTSTDVFHSAGPGLPWERCSETELAGLSLQAPMLAIHTVAAGGGSVVHVDGERLQVGPASAGADPGPACYQRGGPATVTDANLLLGRLRPEAFPALFGPGGDQPLEVAASAARFEALAAQLEVAWPTAPGSTPQPIERLAEGAVAIAVARMAGAIRRISIQRGHDLRQAALVGYGGAGGQHACALAEALGMAQVLLHPLAGVLSAYGMGLAEERRIRERSVLEPLDAACVRRLHELAERLDGEPLPGSSRRVTAWLRLRGAEVSLPAALNSLEAMTRSFLESHQQRYGYSPAGVGGTPVALEVEWLSVERVAAGAPLADRAQQPGGDPQDPEDSPATASLFIDGAWQPASLLSRGRLRPGDRLRGPALITESTGTVLVAPRWDLQVLAGGVDAASCPLWPWPRRDP